MTNPWHVIHAGGLPRDVFSYGTWFVPYFATHESCDIFWRNYCKATKEPTPWGVTDRPAKETK